MKRTAIKRSTTPMSRGKSRLTSKKRLTAKKRISKRSKKKISKDKVWREFSIFIRTRGADTEGFNVCVTCGVRKFWRELQAGHFIAGRNNAVLFCETGTNPQCYMCNVPKHGNGVEYCLWMQRVHGQEVVDRLRLDATQTVKWPKGHLDELYQKYFSLNQENPLTQIVEL